MKNRWRLRLCFENMTTGEIHHKAIDLEEGIAQDFAYIRPLSDYFPGELSFGASPLEEPVKILRKRELRKDLFAREAHRLGESLAEYMEDKEGWHGTDRRDRIREIEQR